MGKLDCGRTTHSKENTTQETIGHTGNQCKKRITQNCNTNQSRLFGGRVMNKSDC